MIHKHDVHLEFEQFVPETDKLQYNFSVSINFTKSSSRGQFSEQPIYLMPEI